MQHPWTRYVAIGDSFTEGVGDPEPSLPNGWRGWPDRVAEELAKSSPGFAYANLAIRGRLLGQIMDEQIDAALEFEPDLVSISGGGNDLLRPGGDPDRVAEQFETAIERLSSRGATVVMFNGPDIDGTPVLRRIRGRVGIYNSNLNSLAHRHDAVVVDMWGAKELQAKPMWSNDRLHFSALGHHTIARLVLDALGVEHSLRPMKPEPLPAQSWTNARTDDIVWAREHLVPWVVRRIRGRSSGDTVSPRIPAPAPYPTVISGTDMPPEEEAQPNTPGERADRGDASGS
ncbi:SGNH/GDSL hydrolase family protein [Humidisolicoccus flavus]|uniref:SGNH/GDSL hydrolase family protein n=1 Tax=Humidisolicoccus flavus TaxID=3111414 RepID=UPI00324705F9